MKNLFEPDDFYTDVISEDNYAIVSARIANKKLNKLIESWPAIYGPQEYSRWSEVQSRQDTIKARLAFIELIPKEPCKHEVEARNIRSGFFVPYFQPKCKNCGVQLKATWSEL